MLVLLGERHEREHHVTDAALSSCDVKAVYTLCARHAHQEDGWPALVKVIYCIIIFIWPCTLCYLFFCSPAIFSRIAILLYWTNNRKREIDNWNAGCKWLMIWMDASESHDTLRCQWGPQNVLTMLCKDIGASDDSRYLALSRVISLSARWVDVQTWLTGRQRALLTESCPVVTASWLAVLLQHGNCLDLASFY